MASGTGQSVVTGSGLAGLVGSGTTTTQGGAMLILCDFASAPINTASANYLGRHLEREFVIATETRE